MDKRLQRLEELASHQAEALARMGEEMYAQQKEIADLRRQLARLQSRLAAADEAADTPFTPDPPPPHY